MKSLRAILIVARREYLAYVAAWGFWLSLVSTPLLFVAMSAAPVLLRKAEPTRVLTVIGADADAYGAIRAPFDEKEREAQRVALWNFASASAPVKSDSAIAAFDAHADLAAAMQAGRAALGPAGANFKAPPCGYRFVAPPADVSSALPDYLTGRKQIDGAPLFAAYVLKGEGLKRQLEYWSVNLTDAEPINTARQALAELMRREALAAQGLAMKEVMRIDEMAPEFSQFDPRQTTGAAVTARDRAPYLAAIALTLVLWSAVIGVANMLLTGVIEEKSNKILDTLLTAVTPFQILCGKLFGVAGVSATLFAVWGVFALFASNVIVGASGPTSLAAGAMNAAMSPALAGTFLACFIAGYLLFGAVFLSVGALCDSIQEAQSFIGPIFLLMVGPLLLIGPAFTNPKAPIVEAASWIPFFAPFMLMLRAPAGLSAAELAGPLIVLGLSIVGVLYAASRLFQAGISHQLTLARLKSKILARPQA
jgi:ABC-2 type transport system permease protein